MTQPPTPSPYVSYQSPELGGYYVAFIGPVIYAFERVRTAGELGRKATFLATTADRWQQGPGAGGQLIPRAAVEAEFARRDAAVKEQQDKGLPKAVWLGLLLILAMLFLLLWTT